MTNPELENLKQIKKNCKTRLTKFKSFLEQYSKNPNKESVNIEELELRNAKIERCWLDFDKAQIGLQVLCPATNLDEETIEFEEFYYRYLGMAKKFVNQRQKSNVARDGQQTNRIAELEAELRSQRESEIIALREVASSRSTNNEQNNRTRCTLPKLNLPTFSGGYEQWMNFRDAFVAIINDDETIPNVQKLRYLRSYLTDEAARVIDNLETTETNYCVAWNLLKDRYDNQRIITQSHIQALFELPGVSKELSTSLRNLLDNTLRHVRALTVLKQPTDKWNTPLIYLVTIKLDRETRKAWEESITGSEMPTFEQLSKFLRERCQILETINYNYSEKQKLIDNSAKPTGRQTQANRNPSAKSFLNTQPEINCRMCNLNHYIQYCPEFQKLSVTERSEAVKKKGLCFNCLRNNHLVSECRSISCTICKRRHHTMLHSEIKTKNNLSKNKLSDGAQKLTSCHIYDASQVLLSTAVINIFDNHGREQTCRVLLDSGSQPNIISRDLVTRLNLRKRKLNLSVEVVNNLETPCSEWVSTRVRSVNSNYVTKLKFLILPQITGNIPANYIDKSSLGIPEHIQLADPDFHRPAKIDALVGAEFFYDLLLEGKVKLARPGLLMQNTKLGWVITGKLGGTWGQNKVKCNLFRNKLNETLEKFWTLEDVGRKSIPSKEENECEKHFLENVLRNNSGRYIVKLPFNEKKQNLGLSYELARKRFFMLERNLDRNPKLKAEYQEFINTYEALGHMQQTRSGIDVGYYMPHQAVIRESSLTTKLRVVFDASAKTTSGISLNEALMIGPTVQDGIFELVIRFRCHNIVLTADIEKMYRQFLIHPNDRSFQKILWRNSNKEPLKTYQLNTVTYGTSAAPFLAIRCLKQLALDEGSAWPSAAEALSNDCYVDDVLTGAENVEEAKKLRDDLIKLTSKAGLKLCKFTSNNPKVIEDLDESIKTTQVNLGPEKNTKTLGVCWNSGTDSFTYEICNNSKEECVSKRTILSQIAQLYDPLGLVAPVVILAKIFLQDLWRINLGWDDKIPEELESSWRKFQSQLASLNEWNITRAVKSSEVTEIQIHGFSDASMKAYGACLYLRGKTAKGYQSTLICAKSRVAPIKTVSLPRLELCGAVLLARLYKSVIEAMRIKVDSAKFWCDSMIVLGWIRSNQRQEIFVGNRVSEIHQITRVEDWSHVPTNQNPADVVSRGQLPEDFLRNDMWKVGPEWLIQGEKDWPNYEKEVQISSKVMPVITLTAETKERSTLWSQYSSLTTLVRSVAYSLRFLNNMKNKKLKTTGPLTARELRTSLERLIKLVQLEEFGKEIKELSREKKIAASSRLVRLSPIIENGILRVGGRIKNADVDYEKQCPVILPKSHQFTDLVIRENHARMFHAGINATLYAVRENYWVIDGRVVVRRILHSCVRCCRAKPKEVSYLMGSLPKVRLCMTRPFENTGVDFCGPFYIKEKVERNRKKIKVYIAVFVCLSIKAVHCELVGQLTTEAFLGCLRRFFARRGKSKSIYSDNGTNFVGCHNELKELHGLLNTKQFDERTAKFLANENIDWHFSPPRTPHFGGIWEAAVNSLKHHLVRTVRDTLFSYEELNTYICEIEAILNSRPLTPMSSDPSDLEALTPGHFLIGRTLSSIPSQDLLETKINRLSSWQHLEKMRQDLWRRWHSEYLSELNVRSKWHTGQQNVIKVGTLVVVREENLPPLRWKMGRVIETHVGDDGIIRVVTVKTETGIYKRGVKKVSPLPIEFENNEN